MYKLLADKGKIWAASGAESANAASLSEQLTDFIMSQFEGKEGISISDVSDLPEIAAKSDIERLDDLIDKLEAEAAYKESDLTYMFKRAVRFSFLLGYKQKELEELNKKR